MTLDEADDILTMAGAELRNKALRVVEWFEDYEAGLVREVDREAMVKLRRAVNDFDDAYRILTDELAGQAGEGDQNEEED